MDGTGGRDGRGRRERRQTRDLVTGVIVNGVNCHLARIWPPNVFMNHDRKGALAVYTNCWLEDNQLPLVKEKYNQY